MKKKITGIIGCGTIGSRLARALQKNFRKQAVLGYFCEHHPEKTAAIRKNFPHSKIVSLKEIIRRCNLIIESASVHASEEILKSSLRAGQDVLIMSVGGLLKFRDPLAAMGRKKARFWIPSGAVAGLDGIAGAREAGIRSVTLITRKPPQGLRTAPYFLKQKFPNLRGSREICVFRGSARAAVKNFPQNINVAAVLSLAGLGADKTRVEIWTSKKYRVNRHEVRIFSDVGEIKCVTVNIPSRENPKTSALAVYSAVACLRKIFSKDRIGT